jgi:hypothetical protein
VPAARFIPHGLLLSSKYRCCAHFVRALLYAWEASFFQPLLEIFDVRERPASITHRLFSGPKTTRTMFVQALRLSMEYHWIQLSYSKCRGNQSTQYTTSGNHICAEDRTEIAQAIWLWQGFHELPQGLAGVLGFSHEACWWTCSESSNTS